jgi:receptor expression-enhancing protein 5/6
MDKVLQYESQLDKELSKMPQLVQLEEQTGVKKTYIVGGVAFLIFSMIFFNLAGGLLTNLIGFAYPAYASFKAIESHSKDDDTQWLTYWTVFGFFNIIEYFTDILVYWIPFYYMLKTFTLLWLYLPTFRGAEYVYHSFISPYLTLHQQEIDSAFSDVKAKAESAVQEFETHNE